MLFSSLTFLFAFLPVVLLGHALLPGRLRNAWLLLLSLLFYAWGEGAFVLVMLGSVLTNWAAAQLIDRWRGQRRQVWALGSGIAFNLLLLGWFKYANFMFDNLSATMTALGGEPVTALGRVHLPIGISFYTFQAISYLVDVNRRHSLAERDPSRVGLYIALFPQLIAGPIVRHGQVVAELRERRVTMDDFAEGLARFIVGLAKKVLIANALASPADAVFSGLQGGVSSGAAWLGIVSYTLQIYFDFSGYSDMAIGLGRMFGFRFPENFRHPYVAGSVTEFWRRWHITLSSWFRDYLYIPLGGNRAAPSRVYLNLGLVFLLCGLWHGASWNFVVWGALHGSFLVAERVHRHVRNGRTAMMSGPGGRVAQRIAGSIYTLSAVMLGWVFFRCESLTQAWTFLRALVTAVPTRPALTAAALVDQRLVVTGVIALLGCAPVVEGVRVFASASALGGRVHASARVLVLLALWWLCVAHLLTGGYNPFIYFRF